MSWTQYATPAFDQYTIASKEALLMQLFSGVTFDGDLISKSDRTWLVDCELAVRQNGWNMITPKGVKILEDLGLIHG